MRNIEPHAKSKMAARGPKNGWRGLERGPFQGYWALWSTFAKWDFWENSCPLSSLPGDRLTATDYNADRSCQFCPWNEAFVPNHWMVKEIGIQLSAPILPQGTNLLSTWFTNIIRSIRRDLQDNQPILGWEITLCGISYISCPIM